MKLVRTAAVTLGVTALLAAGAQVASADTPVQVLLPQGTLSLYVYSGAGPAGDSAWDRCVTADSPIRSANLSIPTERHRHWNFFAYADPGCPIDSGTIGAARDKVAPDHTSYFVVTVAPN